MAMSIYHMPVSKVLKSKVKKLCKRLQLVEDQSIFLKLTLLKMSRKIDLA